MSAVPSAGGGWQDSTPHGAAELRASLAHWLLTGCCPQSLATWAPLTGQLASSKCTSEKAVVSEQVVERKAL